MKFKFEDKLHLPKPLAVLLNIFLYMVTFGCIALVSMLCYDYCNKIFTVKILFNLSTIIGFVLGLSFWIIDYVKCRK